MNKKSILLGILILITVFLTTGCIFYNLLDSKDFKDQFTAIGYTINEILSAMNDPQAQEKGKAAAGFVFNKFPGLVNGIVRFIPTQISNNLFFTLCPVKFKTLGEALVTYKNSSKTGVLMIKDNTKAAKYCFDITYSVMQDVMLVYKDM